MQNREYLRGMCLSVIKDVHVSVTKYLMNTTKVLADLVLFREYHKLTKDDRETNMEKFIAKCVERCALVSLKFKLVMNLEEQNQLFLSGVSCRISQLPLVMRVFVLC